MKKVSWLDLTPEEFIEKRAEYPAVYMPYGLAECHGLYNTMGVDWFSADVICRRAALAHGGIVAPGMPWHCDEEPEFNWSVRANKMGEFIGGGIPPYLFYQTVLYHLRNFDARGFKAVLLLSGHGVQGTEHDIGLLIDYYKRRTGSTIQAKYLCYTKLDRDNSLERWDDEGHAGADETAIAYACRPDIAPIELLGTEPKYPEIGGGCDYIDAYNKPKSFQMTPADGQRLLEHGEYLVNSYADLAGKYLREMYDAWTPPAKDFRVPSFYEVEELWVSFQLITRRYWKNNVTQEQYQKRIPHPDFPGWEWYL